MAEAKVEFTVGSVSFSGEGDKDWVTAQVEKFLKHVPELVAVAPAPEPVKDAHKPGSPHDGHTPPGKHQTLPDFLKAKVAGDKQVDKFLAAAAWLQLGGQSRLRNCDVVKALKKSNQRGLGNASECLSANIGKGYCEKDGQQFFVTQSGLDRLK